MPGFLTQHITVSLSPHTSKLLYLIFLHWIFQSSHLLSLSTTETHVCKNLFFLDSPRRWEGCESQGKSGLLVCACRQCVCVMDDEWTSESLAGIPSDCMLTHWTFIQCGNRDACYQMSATAKDKWNMAAMRCNSLIRVGAEYATCTQIRLAHDASQI